jgi:hypothetical protein
MACSQKEKKKLYIDVIMYISVNLYHTFDVDVDVDMSFMVNGNVSVLEHVEDETLMTRIT